MRPAPPFVSRILLFILLAAAFAAVGALIWPKPSNAEQATIPPSRFDHGYAGNMEIIVDQNSTTECRKRGANANACSWVARVRRQQGLGTCRIILPTGLTSSDRTSIVRHEVGHCNGWSAAHER